MNNIADHVSTEASLAATLDPRRCQFSFADGRRCRSPRWEAHPALCISHARAEAQTASPRDWPPRCHPEPGRPFLANVGEGSAVRRTRPSAAPNFAAELAPLSGEFRTATDINHALGRLFSLLAQNRIPRRNAVALGYLAQLLLQTLPGVREELTRCLGYEAWDETLESVFCDEQAEGATKDGTEAAAEGPSEGATRDLAADGSQASGNAQAAIESQADVAPASDERPAAAAPTEPVHSKVEYPEAALTDAKHPQSEIAGEPEPWPFPAQMPADWNYWKELEQNEHLRKVRH